MDQQLRERRTTHWNAMPGILRRAEQALMKGDLHAYKQEMHSYWAKANSVQYITKLLNKHKTDIVGERYGERCPDCELRDAASSALFFGGSKNGKYDSHIRRHKWYGHKLSLGCETCNNRGRLIDEKKENKN